MRRRVVFALIALVSVLVIGVAGYMLVEGWGFLDALYMTVITVGTVGFREIQPLSRAGEAFTMFMILIGVASLGFALAQLVEFLLEGHILGFLEGRRMEKRIASMQGHTIIAGAGRVGAVVVRNLADERAEFVVVDVTPEAQETAKEQGWAFVLGDATEEDVLIEAGIAHAGAIVTALSGDAENLFVTVTARALNADIFIVARSSHESTEAKLLKAGANRTITPNVIGGRRMASMVLHPTVSDYLDIVSGSEGVEFRLQEVQLERASALVGSSLADSRIRERTGAQVVAVLHVDGRVDANPSASTVLAANERLVVLGTPEQVEALAEVACSR
ncbi:MAG: potassium channel protein [Coriobacteriia bacterium]|nr:potassium channel protein [Coriobacteriia bacterium]